MRVAIIGAGVAGLACAGELAAAGHAVTIFEKARGPGGRISSRRTDHGSFDHGCPVLARGAWLLEFAPLGLELADFAHGEVPVPRMSALARALAQDLDVRSGVRVSPVTRDGAGFRLTADDGADLGAFDRVGVTAPAPQAAELLAGVAPTLAAQAAAVAYDACWAVLAAWGEPLGAASSWQRADAADAPVGWAARESAKPGRDPGERWTIQAGPRWSAAHLEDDPAAVATALLSAFAAGHGADALPVPAFVTAHRWRYARVTRALSDPCLAADGIGAAGDWCAPPPQPLEPGALQDRPGVPEALHGGRALARALAA